MSTFKYRPRPVMSEAARKRIRGKQPSGRSHLAKQNPKNWGAHTRRDGDRYKGVVRAYGQTYHTKRFEREEDAQAAAEALHALLNS